MSEDNLDDILDESAKDFDVKLNLNEEKKQEAPSDEGFKKMFEDVSSNVDFEKMGFNKEEFEKANQMFANMMKDMDKADPTASNPFLQEYKND